MEKQLKTMNYVVVELFNRILFFEEKTMRDQGITLSMNEIHVLEAIQKCQTKTMSDIAQLLLITPGTLTVSTKKLENKGYICKVRDEKDKRIIRIGLTEKALPILDIHENFHKEMIEAFTGNLGKDELEILSRALEQITDFFENNEEEGCSV